jgi:hypothetical protein
MPRYDNCYTILEEVRQGLNEYSTEYMQASDTSGAFNNADIVKKINASQKFIWNLLFTRFPDLFFASTSLTGSSGVYTLPADLFMIHMFTNSEGLQLGKIPLRLKRSSNQTGSDFNYYRSGNTIVRDGGGSSAITLHYFKKMRDMTQGMTSAGGAASATLATTAYGEADYYNSIKIENITDNKTDTITAYTAARVATVTETWAESKYYGTVSELPEPFHHLISLKALISMKSSIVSPEKPNKAELISFQENLVETLRAFTGTYASDVSMDELFYDFRPMFN